MGRAVDVPDEAEFVLHLPAGPTGPDLLRLVKEAPSLGKLFQLLERNDDARRLLFLSKHDLFHLEGPNQFVRFHAAYDSAPAGSSPGRTLAELVSDAGAGHGLGADVLPSLLGASAGSSLIEAFVHGLLVAVNQMPELQHLAAKRKLRFSDTQRLGRRSGGVQGIVSTAMDRASVALQTDENFQKFTEALGEKMQEEAARDFDQFIGQIRRAIPDVMMQFHLAGTEWVKHITDSTGLDVNRLEAVLDDLARLGLVETQSAVAWCQECWRDRTAYQVIAGTWGPSHYRKLRCFGCERDVPMSYTAILYPTQAFRQALLAQDGLLGAYVAWKLVQKGKLKQAFFPSGGRECDFLTTKNSIVEIKMLGAKDRRDFARALDGAIAKVKSWVPKVKEDNPTMERTVLIVNVEDAKIGTVKKRSAGGLPLLVLGIEGAIAELGQD